MSKQSIKPPILIGLSLLLCLITSCSSELEERVKAIEKAHNSHDVEEHLSLYADDTKFELVGFWTRDGKDEVQKLLVADAALNSHLEFTDIRINGDTVTCKVKEQNDWLELGGIDAIYHQSYRFIFEDGLIKETRAELTEQSTQDMQDAEEKVFLPFMQWVNKERSEELTELKSDGEYLITEETVAKWLSLLKEWLQENKQ